MWTSAYNEESLVVKVLVLVTSVFLLMLGVTYLLDCVDKRGMRNSSTALDSSMQPSASSVTIATTTHLSPVPSSSLLSRLFKHNMAANHADLLTLTTSSKIVSSVGRASVRLARWANQSLSSSSLSSSLKLSHLANNQPHKTVKLIESLSLDTDHQVQVVKRILLDLKNNHEYISLFFNNNSTLTRPNRCMRLFANTLVYLTVISALYFYLDLISVEASIGLLTEDSRNITELRVVLIYAIVGALAAHPFVAIVQGLIRHASADRFEIATSSSPSSIDSKNSNSIKKESKQSATLSQPNPNIMSLPTLNEHGDIESPITAEEHQETQRSSIDDRARSEVISIESSLMKTMKRSSLSSISDSRSGLSGLWRVSNKVSTETQAMVNDDNVDIDRDGDGIESRLNDISNDNRELTTELPLELKVAVTDQIKSILNRLDQEKKQFDMISFGDRRRRLMSWLFLDILMIDCPVFVREVLGINVYESRGNSEICGFRSNDSIEPRSNGFNRFRRCTAILSFTLLVLMLLLMAAFILILFGGFAQKMGLGLLLSDRFPYYNDRAISHPCSRHEDMQYCICYSFFMWISLDFFVITFFQVAVYKTIIPVFINKYTTAAQEKIFSMASEYFRKLAFGRNFIPIATNEWNNVSSFDLSQNNISKESDLSASYHNNRVSLGCMAKRLAYCYPELLESQIILTQSSINLSQPISYSSTSRYCDIFLNTLIRILCFLLSLNGDIYLDTSRKFVITSTFGVASVAILYNFQPIIVLFLHLFLFISVYISYVAVSNGAADIAILYHARIDLKKAINMCCNGVALGRVYNNYKRINHLDDESEEVKDDVVEIAAMAIDKADDSDLDQDDSTANDKERNTDELYDIEGVLCDQQENENKKEGGAKESVIKDVKDAVDVDDTNDSTLFDIEEDVLMLGRDGEVNDVYEKDACDFAENKETSQHIVEDENDKTLGDINRKSSSEVKVIKDGDDLDDLSGSDSEDYSVSDRDDASYSGSDSSSDNEQESFINSDDVVPVPQRAEVAVKRNGGKMRGEKREKKERKAILNECSLADVIDDDDDYDNNAVGNEGIEKADDVATKSLAESHSIVSKEPNESLDVKLQQAPVNMYSSSVFSTEISNIAAFLSQKCELPLFLASQYAETLVNDYNIYSVKQMCINKADGTLDETFNHLKISQNVISIVNFELQQFARINNISLTSEATITAVAVDASYYREDEEDYFKRKYEEQMRKEHADLRKASTIPSKENYEIDLYPSELAVSNVYVNGNDNDEGKDDVDRSLAPRLVHSDQLRKSQLMQSYDKGFERSTVLSSSENSDRGNSTDDNDNDDDFDIDLDSKIKNRFGTELDSYVDSLSPKQDSYKPLEIIDILHKSPVVDPKQYLRNIKLKKQAKAILKKRNVEINSGPKSVSNSPDIDSNKNISSIAITRWNTPLAKHTSSYYSLSSSSDDSSKLSIGSQSSDTDDAEGIDSPPSASIYYGVRFQRDEGDVKAKDQSAAKRTTREDKTTQKQKDSSSAEKSEVKRDEDFLNSLTTEELHQLRRRLNAGIVAKYVKEKEREGKNKGNEKKRVSPHHPHPPHSNNNNNNNNNNVNSIKGRPTSKNSGASSRLHTPTKSRVQYSGQTSAIYGNQGGLGYLQDKTPSPANIMT